MRYRRSTLPTWGWSRWWTSTSETSVLLEPPDAEPRIRWCERAQGVTPHPTQPSPSGFVAGVSHFRNPSVVLCSAPWLTVVSMDVTRTVPALAVGGAGASCAGGLSPGTHPRAQDPRHAAQSSGSHKRRLCPWSRSADRRTGLAKLCCPGEYGSTWHILASVVRRHGKTQLVRAQRLIGAEFLELVPQALLGITVLRPILAAAPLRRMRPCMPCFARARRAMRCTPGSSNTSISALGWRPAHGWSDAQSPAARFSQTGAAQRAVAMRHHACNQDR